MEIEILFQNRFGQALGYDGEVYFIRRGPNDYWEEIPANTLTEAEIYFGENVSTCDEE